MRALSLALLCVLLAGCGKAAVSDPVTILSRDPDPRQRVKAARTLGEQGPAAPPGAAPALLAALKDDGNYADAVLFSDRTHRVHEEASKALVKIGGPVVVAGLIKGLSDRQSPVVPRAAHTLGQMGTAARPAAPALVAALNQGLADAASSAGQETIKELLVALEKIGVSPGTPEARAAVPVLQKTFAIQGLPGNERLRAIHLFHPIAAEDRSPIPALIDILAREDWQLGNVTEMLSVFGAGAIPPLLDALEKDKSGGAARVLSRLPAEQTLPLLQKAVSDPRPAVRAGSVKALELLGARAASAVPALRAMRDDPNEPIRVQAARALWVIDGLDRDSFTTLVAALRDPSEDVRHEANQALEKFGPTDKGACDLLAATLKDADGNMRLQAARALGRIGPAARSVLPALREALADPDREVCIAAAKAVARVDPGAKD